MAEITTERWFQLRYQVLALEQRGRCFDCDDYLGRRLELHHLTYEPQCDEGEDVVLGFHVPSPEGGMGLGHWETIDHVVGLCRTCHERRHTDPNGKFWVNPVDMEKKWGRSALASWRRTQQERYG